jgi:hypothetical protein
LAHSGAEPTEKEIGLERTAIAIANAVDIKLAPETIGGA